MSIPTGTEGSSWDTHLADASTAAGTVVVGDPFLPSVDRVAASIISGMVGYARFNCVGEDGITGR